MPDGCAWLRVQRVEFDYKWARRAGGAASFGVSELLAKTLADLCARLLDADVWGREPGVLSTTTVAELECPVGDYMLSNLSVRFEHGWARQPGAAE